MYIYIYTYKQYVYWCVCVRRRHKHMCPVWNLELLFWSALSFVGFSECLWHIFTSPSLRHLAFCAKPPLNRDICWHLTLLICQHKALFLDTYDRYSCCFIGLSWPKISRNDLFCNFSRPKCNLLCNMDTIDSHHKRTFTATSNIKPQKPKTLDKEHSFANKTKTKRLYKKVDI